MRQYDLMSSIAGSVAEVRLHNMYFDSQRLRSVFEHMHHDDGQDACGHKGGRCDNCGRHVLMEGFQRLLYGVSQFSIGGPTLEQGGAAETEHGQRQRDQQSP